MKKFILYIIITSFIIACKPISIVSNASTSKKKNTIEVTLDLIKIQDDKVAVTIQTPSFTTDNIVYQLPKIIPGTYSEDNYGKLITDFKAFDSEKNEIPVTKKDDNSWIINNAKSLTSITYFVNDTFDSEKGGGFGKEDIFSPAGTNIADGKNFLINHHGFIGYFTNFKDITYSLTVLHPETLFGATSLLDNDQSATSDVFISSRYNDLVDNPIMYAKPDFTTFTVDGMEILFSVYSPSGKHSAKSLSPDLEKMMRAQKKFLGTINSNKKYTVLLYLSDLKQKDAKGFGALEHNTSTTVVFPDVMSTAALGKQIIDVVSHEFFHILTPLSVHSNEIHYFDFNAPKMSKHLWMYEGVTEYFANLFQVNQGLITDEAFYNRMDEKIRNARNMNDKMSFTTMSENVLTKPYKDQYLNVYEKGALIAMCIDIEIREKSNGKRGILDMMKELSNLYGSQKPFNDNELFERITQITYPEVGEFLKNYVEGTTPIPFEKYLVKMGVEKSKIKKVSNPFLNGRNPIITGNPTTKEISVRKDIEIIGFLNSIGLKSGDVLLAINGTNYNLETISEMMTAVQNWKENETITIKINRNDKEQALTGKVFHVYNEIDGYDIKDESKLILNKAWLKN